jgi:diguanylate cyclase (GGDEF)-like protein
MTVDDLMKRFGLALVILSWASAWAMPPTLTTLRAVHSLNKAEARLRMPVDFEATVTYYDNQGRDLFVQDGDLAIYVFAAPGLEFVPGDRIRIQGKTDSDFRPDVLGDELTLLRHGPVPEAVPATLEQLLRVELDCVRVRLRARVRSADIVKDQAETNIYLNLLVDGGYVDATVLGQDESKLKELLDAEVEITGAVAGKFDSKMQLAGIMLQVASLSDVKIVEPARIQPGSLPITPMDEILKGYEVNDRSRRMRVRGSVTFYLPGSSIVLQDGEKSLPVSTQFEGPLTTGQVVDVTGFPDARNGFSTLTQSEITPTGKLAPVSPLPADFSQLSSGGHAFDLVSTEGTVLAAVRRATQDEYVLVSNGHLFSAIFRHPDFDILPLPAMKRVAVGSRIRVTGICTMEQGSNPFGVPVAFYVLLRSFNDIDVVAGPSWLSIRNLMIALGALGLVVIVGGARGWALERRVRRHTAALAARIEAEAEMERRRSQILEDINEGRDLGEILEKIAALVSFSLNGAPCWCRLASGVSAGMIEAATDTSPAVGQLIAARSGPAHGEIFAVESPAESHSKVLDRLATGAGLCSLAIETRGLYSDLVHRSEFDLLTDIPNRFSFEKALEGAIHGAQQQAGTLGVIYIDLDKFKEINDVYGHRVGDIFLQQAAQRMKHQLRPGDVLARLGGDEFGVMVPMVANRDNVREIAVRLERCFDHPFRVEDYVLAGSASVGMAYFPMDGETKDSILSAADTAMYVAKHTKCASADVPIEQD